MFHCIYRYTEILALSTKASRRYEPVLPVKEDRKRCFVMNVLSGHLPQFRIHQNGQICGQQPGVILKLRLDKTIFTGEMHYR